MPGLPAKLVALCSSRASPSSAWNWQGPVWTRLAPRSGSWTSPATRRWCELAAARREALRLEISPAASMGAHRPGPHPPGLHGLHRGQDPRHAWAAYALDAQVMLIRGRTPSDWSSPPGLTLRHRRRGTDGALRPPDTDDIAYHLSTLFPQCGPALTACAQQREAGSIAPCQRPTPRRRRTREPRRRQRCPCWACGLPPGRSSCGASPTTCSGRWPA